MRGWEIASLGRPEEEKRCVKEKAMEQIEHHCMSSQSLQKVCVDCIINRASHIELDQNSFGIQGFL